MTKPKVAILTTFYDFNESYSLTSVVKAQLVALVKYGYETVLFVHDNFVDDAKVPKGVEIRKTVPRFLLVDYTARQAVSPDFPSQVQKVLDMLKEGLADIDFVIEHDMIFQGWFLPYAVGIQEYAVDHTSPKWLHWIHSNPSGRPNNLVGAHHARFQLPLHSKLVYLNNYYLIRAAEHYGVFPKDVRIVYNALDPRLFFDLHPLTLSLLDKYPILEADYVQIYPVSTTRMVGGKGLYMLIEIFGQLKKLNKKVCLIILNAHANDKREKQIIAECLSYALQHGLSRNELIFSSLESPPTFELGVPRQVVSQLFQLSNLFIFPSASENCSLILLEAMLSKNLLVLNESVPPMREFARENALYFKFGGIEGAVNFDDREKFMNDVARIINAEFATNKALKAAQDARQKFSYDVIFRTQIEPLFYET